MSVQLLRCWSETCKENGALHREASIKKHRLSQMINLPVIVISAVTASSIFSATAEDGDETWRYINGTLAAVVTVLSSTARFLKLDERSERHRQASISYNDLYSLIDSQVASESISDDQLEETRKRMIAIRKAAPNISHKNLLEDAV